MKRFACEKETMNRKARIIHALILLSIIITGAFSSTDRVAADRPPVWKFAVISDTQSGSKKDRNPLCINSEILAAMVKDITAEKPDLVLVSGDLVNGWFKNGGTGFATQYQNWNRVMAPVFTSGIKVFAVRGNHDSGPERLALPPLPARFEPQKGELEQLKKEFMKALIKPYTPLNGPENEKGLTYTVVHKNACIIGLDQYSGGQHRVDQKWLDGELSRNRQPHLFLFGHEPAFETDHKDNLSFYPEKRDLFWDSIGTHGGKIYFCGHDHFYNRALIRDRKGNPVWQIIAGTGGGKLRTWSGTYKAGGRATCAYHNNKYHGYILVTIDGMDVLVQWKALVDVTALKWQVLDRFSCSRSPIPDSHRLIGSGSCFALSQ
ncbi:MAG TPA: metallophosphoesterase [Spirochaetota bacterium]|nr:metallophosphoesterase [Spirochaetota bacterium]HPI90347.1 metallophosphoesterase [Spirochaetota bacterium]HPR48485.1 metallophosphoesterase [Spirochaetota bacterium]